MNRPLSVRLLPDRAKAWAFHRFYNPVPERFAPLLARAPLKFAPGAVMTGLLKGDVISDCIAMTGIYELELSRDLVRAAKPGGRLVDVGANLGYFSVLWLAAQRDTECIAIEASPRNVALLKENLAVNRFQTRCRLEEAAAGEGNGTLRLMSAPRSRLDGVALR